MKKLLIVVLTLLLAGCTTRVSTWVLLEAEAICAEHKGVDHILIDVFNVKEVMCRDGYWSLIKVKQ